MTSVIKMTSDILFKQICLMIFVIMIMRKFYYVCRGRVVSCIGLKFWCCQNVGSNPVLARRGACVLEQDT